MNDRNAPTIEQFEWNQKREKIKKLFADAFKAEGLMIPEEELDSFINTPAIRNIYIRHVYIAERRRGKKVDYLNNKLGEIFGLTADGIKKITTLANTMPIKKQT